MTTRHLFSFTRRSRHLTAPCLTQHTRFASQLAQAAEAPAPASPPPPDLMIYDRLAERVKSKLRKLERPDPRFLQHNSPHPIQTDHTSILSVPETRVTTLPNGLRVATESNLAAKTAAIGVSIDAGSRFETDDNNGVAHFLEHLIFKGTEKRIPKAFEEEIENMGGHISGSTSREMTTYCAKVQGKDVTRALQLLSDIVQNPKLEDEKINHERKVILREMEEGETDPKKIIFDQLHATAFQYTPLGRTVTGSAENIKKISKEDIQNYISTQYAAHRMVISAAGAVKHEDFVEQVKKFFTKLSANPVTTPQLVANSPAIFTGSEVRIIDDLPLAQFAVAFNGASWTDPDSTALMVLQQMFGSWNKSCGGGKHMGSALVQRVAINEIGESVMGFNINYKDTGLFGVYAVAKPDCLDDLAYSIMYEICKLCYRVSEADVIRARNQLKSSLILQINGSSATAEEIGHQLITYGRRIPYAELFARIDAVDASTIKRVANRFIFDREIAIAARGAIQGYLPDYNWFRRRTYWLRY
nr:probable mitochondrial-processing peptidase subunit beta, mitochondrial [Ipomoea batatas]